MSGRLVHVARRSVQWREAKGSGDSEYWLVSATVWSIFDYDCIPIKKDGTWQFEGRGSAPWVFARIVGDFVVVCRRAEGAVHDRWFVRISGTVEVIGPERFEVDYSLPLADREAAIWKVPEVLCAVG